MGETTHLLINAFATFRKINPTLWLTEDNILNFKEFAKQFESANFEMGNSFGKTKGAKEDKPEQEKTPVELLLDQVTQLEKEIDSFTSTHQCLEYRVLGDKGAKLQFGFDKIQPTDAASKQQKKDGLIRSEKALTKLSGKIHSGPKCKFCS